MVYSRMSIHNYIGYKYNILFFFNRTRNKLENPNANHAMFQAKTYANHATNHTQKNGY